MNWAIQALARDHERERFTCGYPQLDDYLRKQAGQHTRKNVARVYVAVRAGERRVLGYYSLSASSVEFAEVPVNLSRRLPRYPIPTVLIGKLTVDRSVRGEGLGEHLLLDALQRVVVVSAQMAVAAVEVDAIDAQARGFYLKYGFQPFLDSPLHLFLPVATLGKLF